MPSSLRVGSGFAVLALLPALKIVDNPVIGTAVSVLVGELHLLSGFGFLLLLGYVLVAETRIRTSQEQQLTPDDVLSGLPPLLGIVLGGGLLLMWMDAGGGFFGLIGLVASLFNVVNDVLIGLNGGWLVYQDWWTYEPLARSLGDMERLMTRSLGRATRWPFYLFFTAVTLSATITRNQYLDRVSVLSRAVTVGLLSVFTGVFALIISHNYFPSMSALPWRARSMAGWTVLTAVCLVIYLASIRTFGDGEGPPIVPTLVVTYALGTVIATIDALYPIPELLVIGAALCSSVEPLRDRLPKWWSVQSADIHSSVVSATASCWERPVSLFLLLPAVSGVLIGGWFLYVIYWLVPLRRNSLLATLLVWVVVIPLFATGVYMLWFWLREISVITDPSRRSLRPKGMLLTPALVLTGYVLVNTFFVPGMLLIFAGLAGLAVSAHRFYRHDWVTELPTNVAIPVAYGLVTVPPTAVNWALSADSTLFVGTIALLPLSLLPWVYDSASRASHVRIAVVVSLTPLCVALVYSGYPTTSQLNNGVLAVLGVVLAIRLLVNPTAGAFGGRV